MISKIRLRKYNAAFAFVMASVLVLGSSCCRARLMADYDEQVDLRVTEIQKKVDALLQKIETNVNRPNGSHNNLVPAYKEIYEDINNLHERVSLKENNKQIIRQVALLKRNLEQFEEIHKTGIQSADVVAPVKEQINVICESILKTERFKNIAKKE